MNSTHIISQDVFDKIRSRFQNLEMGDEQGGVTTDPKEARFFDFDFVVEGKNLGRVSISINETGTLKIFYSQGILEDSDDFIHQLWYDFLREMRMFAKRRLLRFDTRDITKSNLNKNDFQYLASTGQKDTSMNMNESAKFEGSKKTSYRVLEKTKLIAKHKKSIENEAHGARSRGNNIKALYIENSEGERFKYPFIHIAGAKAMQRHVANGGRPYDDKGTSIIKMSEEILQLSAFKRHIGKPDGMNQKVNEITSKTESKLQILRRTVENLSNQSFYEQWSERFVPNNENLELDEATLEDYKNAFTVSSFREDLMQYFPLIHKIMHETSEVDLDDVVRIEQVEEETSSSPVDDFATFEEWANRLEEGKLEPDTIMQLKDLLDQGLTLDVDGRSTIDALQGIGINDEELENALAQLSKVNPEADPKDTILGWLAKDDLEAAQELGYKGGETAPEEEEPAMADELPKEDTATKLDTSKNSHVRKIAEKVFSHYNRHHKEQGLGPFPKGEKGIYQEVKNDLGDEAGELAIELIKELGGDISSLKDTSEAIDPKNPRDYEKPAYMRRQAGQAPLTTKAGLAKRKAELGLSESDIDRILNLAGLRK